MLRPRVPNKNSNSLIAKFKRSSFGSSKSSLLVLRSSYGILKVRSELENVGLYKLQTKYRLGNSYVVTTVYIVKRKRGCVSLKLSMSRRGCVYSLQVVVK